MEIPKKKKIKCSGQGLIEFLILTPLFLIFWISILWILIDGIGIMLWNYKLEKHLICRKDFQQRNSCFEDFKKTQSQISWIRLKKYQEQNHLSQSSVSILLSGNLISCYEIQKYLDPSIWKK